MALSIADRGLVEKITDETISLIPQWIEMYRNEDLIKFYQYKSVEDFVYGITLGYIQSGFSFHFRINHKVDPTKEQLEEFGKTCNNRMREVKEAIFKTG